jgi:hypothetical protein
MEVAWSKVGAIRRMLEDFPLLLLHGNARPHNANKTNETLRNYINEYGMFYNLQIQIVGTSFLFSEYFLQHRQDVR